MAIWTSCSLVWHVGSSWIGRRIWLRFQIERSRGKNPPWCWIWVKKSNHYIVSLLSSAHLRSFAPRPTYQYCSGSKLLATCERFDWLKIWTLYLPLQGFNPGPIRSPTRCQWLSTATTLIHGPWHKTVDMSQVCELYCTLHNEKC